LSQYWPFMHPSAYHGRSRKLRMVPVLCGRVSYSSMLGSRYALEFSATTGKPKGIARPVLFGKAIALPQPRLFGLEVLGEGVWLKALKLEDYAPRKARPGSLQQSLLPYHEAGG
jgi:hypothetical protein